MVWEPKSSNAINAVAMSRSNQHILLPMDMSAAFTQTEALMQRSQPGSLLEGNNLRECPVCVNWNINSDGTPSRFPVDTEISDCEWCHKPLGKKYYCDRANNMHFCSSECRWKHHLYLYKFDGEGFNEVSEE